MKRILITVTVLMAVLGATVSNAQDANFERVIKDLMGKFNNHSVEINAIAKDVLAWAESTRKQSQKDNLLIASNCFKDTATEYNHCILLLGTINFVDKNDRNLFQKYTKYIYHSMKFSLWGLTDLQKLLEDIYPSIENKEARHSADKAKKIKVQGISDTKIAMDAISKDIH